MFRLVTVIIIPPAQVVDPQDPPPLDDGADVRAISRIIRISSLLFLVSPQHARSAASRAEA